MFDLMEDTGNYQDGRSARQYSCKLSLEENLLHIYLQGERSDLLIWDLERLQSCHLNGSHLILKYGAYPHQTLECEGEMAARIHRIWSGGHVIRKAEGYTVKRRALSVLVLIAVFIVLGGFALFGLLPWIGEKAANLVPLEAEVQMGESLAGIYTRENEMSDSANYYMREFVKQLDLDDTYKIDVRVITSDYINAFALPGGKIFIYSGIIERMNSYPELVALLGHEVSHVTSRHSLKSICRSAATSVVVASLFGDITGISAGILSQAEQFEHLNYSRSLETEADNNGLNIMLANQIDPRGMLDLLRLLKAEGAEMPRLMKYLSTHPDTDSRIANISSRPGISATFPEKEEMRRLFTRIREHL